MRTRIKSLTSGLDNRFLLTLSVEHKEAHQVQTVNGRYHEKQEWGGGGEWSVLGQSLHNQVL